MRFEFRHVPLVMRLVAESGGRTDDLLRQVGIGPGEGAEPVVIGPVERIEALLAEAAVRTGLPSFGLALASRVERGRFGWLEFGMRTAPTFGDAMALLAQYSSMINREAGYLYATREAESVVAYETPRRPHGLGPQLNEFTIGLVLANVSEALVLEWCPLRIWFAHPEPTSPSVARHFDPAPVSFGASTSGFGVAPAVAAAALAGHDPALNALLRARLEEIMPAASASRSMSSRTRSEVLSRLGRRPHGLADVARALGTSPRTLQRELAAESTSFVALVDGVRRELATVLITRHDLRLGEVAALVGYADLRGFERAFVRWTGVLPTEYRR